MSIGGPSPTGCLGKVVCEQLIKKQFRPENRERGIVRIVERCEGGWIDRILESGGEQNNLLARKSFLYIFFLSPLTMEKLEQ